MTLTKPFLGGVNQGHLLFFYSVVEAKHFCPYRLICFALQQLVTIQTRKVWFNFFDLFLFSILFCIENVSFYSHTVSFQILLVPFQYRNIFPLFFMVRVAYKCFLSIFFYTENNLIMDCKSLYKL